MTDTNKSPAGRFLRVKPHSMGSMHDKGSSEPATGKRDWPAKAELGGSIPVITINGAKIVIFWKTNPISQHYLLYLHATNETTFIYSSYEIPY